MTEKEDLLIDLDSEEELERPACAMDNVEECEACQ